MDCLVCRQPREPFHTLPRRALFTKPMVKPRFDATGDMELLYCDSCRHVSSRIHTSLSPEELHAITYGELYMSYAPTGLSGIQLRYTEFVARWLAEVARPNSRILEIGSHDGYVLSLLAARGHSCEGVEPSPYADIAREKYGLSVRKEFFDVTQYDAASFDFIIMRHVVEHVDDPVTFVKNAGTLLRPGGLMYVEVPNSQWSLEEAYFPEFHADHISYFSMASVRELLRRAGNYRVLHAEAVSAYMRFPFLNVLVEKAASSGASDSAVPSWFRDFRTADVLDAFRRKFEVYESRLRDLPREQPLVVWGTGSIGIQYAIDGQWQPADATYVDPNPTNHGLSLSVSGHPIHAPEILAAMEGATLLVASGWEEDVRRQAQKHLVRPRRQLGFAELVGGAA